MVWLLGSGKWGVFCNLVHFEMTVSPKDRTKIICTLFFKILAVQYHVVKAWIIWQQVGHW